MYRQIEDGEVDVWAIGDHYLRRTSNFKLFSDFERNWDIFRSHTFLKSGVHHVSLDRRK